MEDLPEKTWTDGDWDIGHLGSEGSCQCAYVFSDHLFGSICDISVDNELCVGEGGNDSPPKKEAIGNMHLISKAPKLYEALEKVFLKLSYGDEIHSDEIEGLHKLLMSCHPSAKVKS
jgi:hypothetical protein